MVMWLPFLCDLNWVTRKFWVRTHTHTDNIASRWRAWYELKEKCLHNTYSCKDMRSKEEEDYTIYCHTFTPRRGDCSLSSGMKSQRLGGNSSGCFFCFTICALNTCMRNWPTSCHLSKCPETDFFFLKTVKFIEAEVDWHLDPRTTSTAKTLPIIQPNIFFCWTLPAQYAPMSSNLATPVCNVLWDQAEITPTISLQ